MPKHNPPHTAPPALPFCILCYHPPSHGIHAVPGMYVHILLNLSLLNCVNLTMGWVTDSFSWNTQLYEVSQLNLTLCMKKIIKLYRVHDNQNLILKIIPIPAEIWILVKANIFLVYWIIICTLLDIHLIAKIWILMQYFIFVHATCYHDNRKQSSNDWQVFGIFSKVENPCLEVRKSDTYSPDTFCRDNESTKEFLCKGGC
jgi:hypothetical protein